MLFRISAASRGRLCGRHGQFTGKETIHASLYLLPLGAAFINQRDVTVCQKQTIYKGTYKRSLHHLRENRL